jgi:hypothetical protein
MNSVDDQLLLTMIINVDVQFGLVSLADDDNPEKMPMHLNVDDDHPRSLNI